MERLNRIYIKKRLSHFLFFLLGILLMCSCSETSESKVFSKTILKTPHQELQISLVNTHDTVHELRVYRTDTLPSIMTSKWPIGFPVYKMKVADINNDGRVDVLVGVIKKTRMDSVRRKRVFIYNLYKGKISPLWLGSRFGFPITDFEVLNEKGVNKILTTERDKSGKLLKALYKWKGFGFEFIRYI